MSATTTTTRAAGETAVRVSYHGAEYSVPKEFITQKHPGGAKVVLRYKDGDISEAFDKAEHSHDALEMLEEWSTDPNLSPEKKAELKRRAEARRAKEEAWRWRSTAIAFGVAAVVSMWLLRNSPILHRRQ